MKLPARLRRILARKEHDDVSARGDLRPLGELPARRPGQIVGKAIARKVDFLRRSVVKLDPVGIQAVFIEYRRAVGSHEFVDYDARRSA
ncbi:hypothetical protein SDC9_199685 [bioreactor metagenome]|uniref:Uncharacterized protein n=1 Tax=bioreactor metagenome TaxID=1076179 RepID=A0A645IXU3_9ZZZZ